MAWTDFKIDRSSLRIRPGLLLFSIVFSVVLLLGLTPIPRLLGKGHTVARISVLLVATIFILIGCFFLNKDSESYRPWRMWATLVAIICIAVSIPAFVLFTAIPLRMLIWSRFGYAVSRVLMSWGDLLSSVGWVGSFFGHGRSRLFLVIGSTNVAVLWGAARS
jgi:hypothetical protein